MNKILLLIIFFSLSFTAFSQQSIQIEGYNISLEAGRLNVKDNAGNVVYKRNFSGPSLQEYDLDGDGTSELVLIDSADNNNKPSYKLYVFNTVDGFELSDSILSGSAEPYEQESEEAGGTIIIAGNPECDIYNTDPEMLFLPINCWKYEAGEVMLINDEIYDNYISENEEITDFLEDYLSSNIKNCTSSAVLKSAIAAAYINYINAGENAIASQFIKKYYLCGDIQNFIDELASLSGNLNSKQK